MNLRYRSLNLKNFLNLFCAKYSTFAPFNGRKGMKKLFLLFSLPLLVAACSSKNEPDAPEKEAQSFNYSGEMLISLSGIETPVDGLKIEIIPAQRRDIAKIKFYRVSFMPGRMPEMDLDIDSVPMIANTSAYSLSGTNLTTLYLDQPYADCPAQSVEADWSSDSLKMDVVFAHKRFGAIPVHYEGARLR